MNFEDQQYLANQQALQGQASQNAMQGQQIMYMQEQEKGLAEHQLDVEEIINNVYNLLRGYQLKDVGKKKKEWTAPTDNSMKTLSEWGVHRIMQIVRFYINRNNLLTNYDADQILKLMYRFATEINDLFLMKYELLLYQTTTEEATVILKNKIEERIKTKMKRAEVFGENINEENVRKEVLSQLREIDEELWDVKQEELKKRIREYGILLNELESQVYATLNRAYRGEERGSLRRHATFSDIRTSLPQQQQKQGGGFSWLKR